MYLQHRTITGLLLSQLGENEVVHKYHPVAEKAASSPFKNKAIGEDVDVHSVEEVYSLTSGNPASFPGVALLLPLQPFLV